MKVILKPGEGVTICLEGTDGEINAVFKKTGFKVSTDLPDDLGRSGIIYEEKFGMMEKGNRKII